MITGQILVVEDESDSMEVVQSLLTYHAVRSRGVGSAEEALALLETETPELIILDLALPKMDGFSLLKRLKNERRLDNTPIVAITAYHTPELADQAIIAGFSAYFAKPLDATSFVRELERLHDETR